MRSRVKSLVFAATVTTGSLALAVAMAATGDHLVSEHSSTLAPADAQAFLNSNCIACHSAKLHTANLVLENQALLPIGPNAIVWEKVVAKLQAGEMPPTTVKTKPDPHQTDALVSWLITSLDKYAAANPDAGRPVTRRLTRTEYSNAVRDLLAIDVKPGDDLPPDVVAFSFNNNGDALSLSPLLFEKYLSVARKVARLATSDPSLLKTTYSYPPSDHAHEWYLMEAPDKQSTWRDGVPFGATSGPSFPYYFPSDGDYVIRVFLNSTVMPDSDEAVGHRKFEIRTHVTAGQHTVAAMIAAEHALQEGPIPNSMSSAGALPGPIDILGTAGKLPLLDIRLDGKRLQRFEVKPNTLTEIRAPAATNPGVPAIRTVQVEGPFNPSITSQTPSRARIFICHPTSAGEETPCATRILTTLLRGAFRRDVTADDVKPFVTLYQKARADGSFEDGIREAIQAILVSPHFIFRVEKDPEGVAAGKSYQLDDFDLATRLSFLIWSSIPDDRLLNAARAGQLHSPEGLKREVARMLADPKAAALVDNFGMQYVGLEEIDNFFPSKTAYPGFNLTLRDEFKEETRRFLQGMIGGNRSIVDLVNANYSYLNADLAKHYGIDGVVGDQFRKVTFKPGEPRGGVLTQGSVLLLTSHEDITSPVLRGKWVLTNLFNQPPPNPPPGVPTIVATDVASGKVLTARAQLDQHLKSPVCAACHVRMDPFGLSLENFDVTGAWRLKDPGGLIDASVTMPDGSGWSGVEGLKKRLASNPQALANAFAGRLMVYALGRKLEATDQPAIREIVRDAALHGYRFDDILMGVINSVQFQKEKDSGPMTYVRGIHLHRRSLLKGIGGLAMSLPFLNAMTPAFAQAAATKSPKRFVSVYFPNGYITAKWTPTAEGTDFTLPYALEPLQARKDKVSILTHLCDDPSKTNSSFHDRVMGSMFTGVEMSKTEVKAGPSIDQVAAQALGKNTQLASMELAAEESLYFGLPYWASATNRLPVETNPRSVFERLFGDADSLDPAVLAKLRDQRASILDALSSDAASLKQGLGSADRIKLDEYFNSVRDIENRLNVRDNIAAQNINMDRPGGPPSAYADLVRLMFDLQVVALRTDKTRVISFMMGGEASNMEFPEINWFYSHHLTSHHGGDPVKMQGLSDVNRYQIGLFDYYLGKLAAVQEADGSLLDNSLVLYASGLGDADHHMAVDLPVLLAGGASMGHKGGRHVNLPNHTPITSLYLSMMDKLGVPLDKFGDSSSRIQGVFDV